MVGLHPNILPSFPRCLDGDGIPCLLRPQDLPLYYCLVCLGDMGVCHMGDMQREVGTVCGTPYTMAPEVAQQQPYNDKADVYSIGRSLFEML